MDRRRERCQRGEAAVETVLVAPIVLFLVLLVIQAGLWFHGSQLVEAAAQEGMQAGRVETGTVSAAEERAKQFVTSLSPSIAATTEVQASRTASTTRVTVTAQVQQVVPGLRLAVSGVAEGPTERFREDR